MSNLIGCDAILVSGGGGGGATLDYEFHYTADDVVESGGAVSQMNDQSGSGNDGIQSNGAYQPSYNASDANFNNLPSVSFNGDYFAFKKWIPYNIAEDFYLIFVGSASASTNSFLLSNPDSANSRLDWFASIDLLRVASSGTDYLNEQTFIIASGTAITDAAVWLITSNGGNVKAFKNGVQFGTTYTGTVYNCGSSMLGKNTNMEMIIADIRLKNEYDLTKINTDGSALATKYGFTWNTIT